MHKIFICYVHPTSCSVAFCFAIKVIFTRTNSFKNLTGRIHIFTLQKPIFFVNHFTKILCLLFVNLLNLQVNDLTSLLSQNSIDWNKVVFLQWMKFSTTLLTKCFWYFLLMSSMPKIAGCTLNVESYAKKMLRSKELSQSFVWPTQHFLCVTVCFSCSLVRDSFLSFLARLFSDTEIRMETEWKIRNKPGTYSKFIFTNINRVLS